MLKQSSILTIFVLVFSTAQSQTGHRNVFKVLSKIKAVPSWYASGYKYEQTNKERFKGVDSTYAGVAKFDTNAIIYLMDFLVDTSASAIPNTCQGGSFTYGQLAFFLINDIEPVPYYLVTKSQWDVLGECGVLPFGFLNYLKENGRDFESKYRSYFNSQERQKWLKQFRKGESPKKH